MEEKQIYEYMTTKKYKENEYLCWDFVRDVYKDLYNMDLPEYPVDELPVHFKHRMEANFEHKKIENGQAIEGDIIVFSLMADQHAGVMIDSNYLIHLGKTNVRISRLSDLGKNYVIYRIVK